jgi:soluble lytic murein transglycosylase
VTRRLAALLVMTVGVLTALVYLQNPGTPDFLQRIRYPLRYQQYVRAHARNYGIDPALLAAVIYQESKFDAHAHSDSGAIGLMQLRPATAHGIALRTGGAAFRTSDLENPEINIRYGSWYLRHLFRKYGDERLVLAAYNAGQGNVDRWRARGEEIQFAETRAYVDRVEDLKRIYRDAWASELGLS